MCEIWTKKGHKIQLYNFQNKIIKIDRFYLKVQQIRRFCDKTVLPNGTLDPRHVLGHTGVHAGILLDATEWRTKWRDAELGVRQCVRPRVSRLKWSSGKTLRNVEECHVNLNVPRNKIQYTIKALRWNQCIDHALAWNQLMLLQSLMINFRLHRNYSFSFSILDYNLVNTDKFLGIYCHMSYTNQVLQWAMPSINYCLQYNQIVKII